MDLENKALREAFNKKYGGIKTDNEDYKRFAKKFYGLDKKQEPSLIEKAKSELKDWYDFNLGGGRSGRK